MHANALPNCPAPLLRSQSTTSSIPTDGMKQGDAVGDIMEDLAVQQLGTQTLIAALVDGTRKFNVAYWPLAYRPVSSKGRIAVSEQIDFL